MANPKVRGFTGPGFLMVHNVMDQGADHTRRSNSHKAFQKSIDNAALAVDLHPDTPAYQWLPNTSGSIVVVPEGSYRTDEPIILHNSVSLWFESVRTTHLVAGDNFVGDTVIDCVDGTNPIFNSAIHRARIHANNNPNIQQVIRAQAWQERCGLFDCSIDGYQNVGLLVQDVSGGSAGFTIERTGFSAFSGASAGIRVDNTVPNAFQLGLLQASINGGGGAAGVQMDNGHLNAINYHTENVINGLNFTSGAGGIVNGITGASDVTNLMAVQSGFNGALSVFDMDVNGGTRAFRDEINNINVTGSPRKLEWPFSIQFPSNDSTPSVAKQAPYYRTFNTSATTITNFDSGVPGQSFGLRIQDALTTFQIGSNIRRADGSGSNIVTPPSNTFFWVTNDRGTWVMHQG